MFKRRDIPPVLLLLLLIILVMLTLSQILVVHNGRYGRSVHNMRKLQLELREMDINLHSLMMQNVPSIELNRRLLQNEINAGRIAAIIAQASKTQRKIPERTRFPAAKASGSVSNQMDLVGHEPRDNGHMTHVGQGHVTKDGQQVAAVAAEPEVRTQNGGLSLLRTNSGSNKTTAHTSNSNGSSQRQPSSLASQNSQLLSSTNVSSSSSSSSSVALSTHADALVPSDQPSVHPPPFLHTNHQRTGPVMSLENANSDVTGHVTTGSHMSPGGGEYGLMSRMSLSNGTQNGRRSKASYSHRSKGKNGKDSINYCPSIPPGLKGRVFVNFEHRHNFSEAEIVRQNPYIQPGGLWRPTACVARHRVAVIIPYRDRWEHLMILLSHLHPILERQQLDYRIFVVEQAGRDTFNKARIMNIAFVEALKQNNFQCFVFHDVDLVPEDDRNMYSCPIQPRHMSVAIDEMGYKLAYQELVGGVLNMRTEHFQRVNGYSNLYWGWGAEDDDMAYRIMHVGLKITRPPEGVARYKMVKHTKRKPADWRKRAKLLYTGTRRFQFDGLNSLQYRVVHIKKLPLFSHILVDIGKPPRGF